MRVVYALFDTLNRQSLECYGGTSVRTPNFNRLAAQTVAFDNHYVGSLPCMPARRDLYTGHVNFLETPWSPLQPWDDCLQPELRRQRGVYSHMVTDHYHYFHSGGECYHTRFDSWDFERGQRTIREWPFRRFGSA